MLRRITAKQLRDWLHYDSLEPFGDIRADIRTASIVAMIANVNRGEKQPPYEIKDFLLRFDVEAKPPRPKQTWQEQKRIAYIIAEAFNAKGVNT